MNTPWPEKELSLINLARNNRVHPSGPISSACGETNNQSGRMTIVWDEATGRGSISCLGRRGGFDFPEEMFASAHCAKCPLIQPGARVDISKTGLGGDFKYQPVLVLI